MLFESFAKLLFDFIYRLLEFQNVCLHYVKRIQKILDKSTTLAYAKLPYEYFIVLNNSLIFNL